MINDFTNKSIIVEFFRKFKVFVCSFHIYSYKRGIRSLYPPSSRNKLIFKQTFHFICIDLYIFFKSIILFFYLLKRKASQKNKQNPNLVYISMWGDYYKTFSFFLMRNLLSDSNCCTAQREGIKISYPDPEWFNQEVLSDLKNQYMK